MKDVVDWAAERCHVLSSHIGQFSKPAPHYALQKLVIASDFAHDWLQHDPTTFALIERDQDQPRPLAFTAAALKKPEDFGRWRRRESVLQIYRDVTGRDDTRATLQRCTACAEVQIRAAARLAQSELDQRSGRPHRRDGKPQQLLVVGMGKLGGGELNFSSDIDLICTYAEPGETPGPRVLDHQEYFTRAVTRMVAHLADSSDGIPAYRVDLRLRPFGSSGPTALCVDALEQYYQREGRDWERYAWIKGRVLTGLADEARLVDDLLRPFVYRRYLDFGAFAGLRDLKSRIDEEVRRRDVRDNIKLGRGGIREIEFLVQLVQLVRGGREPSLRVRGTLAGMDAIAAQGLPEAHNLPALRSAYWFFRQVENRIQMLGDAQTHDLPADAFLLRRLAYGLGFTSVDALCAQLAAHREVVAAHFDAVVLPGESNRSGGLMQSAWNRISAGPQEADAGPAVPDVAAEAMQQLKGSVALRAMNSTSRSRLDAVLPNLLELAAASAEPARVTSWVVAFVQVVARRTSYLALLAERPQLPARLIGLCAQSAWLAQRLIDAPILLDDLLDQFRLSDFSAAHLSRECARALANVPSNDEEHQLLRLKEFQLSAQLRLGVALLRGDVDAAGVTAGLARIADIVLRTVLRIASAQISRRHGVFGAPSRDGAPRGFAVIGYGSLGGLELNFASDLDLVFVFDDALTEVESGGPAALDGQRYMVRLAQRLLALLTMPSAIGALYEIDTRLQPDGNKGGLLVSGIRAYSRYLLQRAWTYEHQALVRARCVAGDPRLVGRFTTLRARILALPRPPETLAQEVAVMRAKMRAHLDRSTATRFDLKQGEGGLVDIEFVLQQRVLVTGQRKEWASNSAELFAQIADPGLATLARRHADLLERGLRCTLQMQPRIIDHALVSTLPGGALSVFPASTQTQ